ncbi:purine-cytosine permease family protein [Corynebacterium kroppenstedtii]|uniref:purine-cytosine permease family protein n=1 Tax=Corynebacterium sp. PCR 32 TaxID=3351342 RepID=UPI0030B3D5C7
MTHTTSSSPRIIPARHIDSPPTIADTGRHRSPSRQSQPNFGDDYPLRFAPRHYRTWGVSAVATSALGGIAYLADFSIGAGIGITHGTINAVGGILIAAVLIFISSFPLAVYAARYNLDLDLITRGSGFGYYGSVITNVIFASFTFIFFATEGSIMGQGLTMGLGLPLWIGYLIATLIVIPLVMYGMAALAKIHTITNPLWIVMMVSPIIILITQDPSTVDNVVHYSGHGPGHADLTSMMLATGVCLSLTAQIAENIDYIRFMPARTPENTRRWWIAVILSGPGWVIFGATKQIIGVVLAVYVIASLGGSEVSASEPVHQFFAMYTSMMPSWLAVTLAVTLVVMSQIKINVTNAYSGSLAWTNAYTRVTKRYPGRTVFVFVNVGIALMLMEFNIFTVLNSILGFYSNVAIAWIFTVATDIAINKYVLKISPRYPEYRRGIICSINPVGVGALLLSASTSIAIYFGIFGTTIQPFSALSAACVAAVSTPLIAIATGGRFYLRRSNDGINSPLFDTLGNPSDELFECCITGEMVERPDVVASAIPTPDGRTQYISSLALTTDRHGHHVLPADKRFIRGRHGRPEYPT